MILALQPSHASTPKRDPNQALQRALAASPDNSALLGQLSSLESLVQRSLAAQLRPPSPPPPVPPPGLELDQAALHAAVEAAVGLTRTRTRSLTLSLSLP